VTRVVASAPGKVVLCGEYAVLEEAPAICMAVDRRARVDINTFDGEWHCVRAPGYSDVEGRFRIRSGGVEWLQGGDEFDLVTAVVEVTEPAPSTSLCIDLDTREFQDSASGDKLGLGSSAALTVALSAALKRTPKVLDDSMAAHRRLQQGTGSGVDIAAAVQGGLIEYRRRNCVITPLSWPAGLHYRLLWSGKSSSTREKLSRYADAENRQSRVLLGRAAENMARAWRSGADVLAEFPAYIDTLRQFSVDHDLGIFDAGHDQLVADAEAAGLVYKPCGAGGGDIGILLGISDVELDEFIANGRTSLECTLAHVGVKLEQQ
jgi:phosphomevalonate kinase